MERIAVTPQDQMFIDLDRSGEPWNAYMELWVAGRLDADRLRSAIRAAMERHPIARARLADTRDGGRSEWEVPDDVERVPLTVVECPDAAALGRTRSGPLNRAPRLDESPPFELVLARHSPGDALIMNLHHAVGDGVALSRLVSSICRAYAGLEDPLPDLDPLAARDLSAVAGRRKLADRLKRLGWHLRQLADSPGPPAQLAPSVHEPVAEESAMHCLTIDEGETARLRARKRSPATLNDLLLGGLAVAARRWNDARGVVPARIALKAPLNFRPPEWANEVIANLAAGPVISIPVEAQGDLDSAQLAVADAMRRQKDQAYGEILAYGGVLPVRVKRLVKPLLASRFGDGPPDTAIFSNMGRPGIPADLGSDGGRVTGVWVTTAVRTGLGLTVVVTSLGDQLCISFHYGPKLFDAQSSGEFASLFRETLLGGT
jgi:NRPS condensation-like uncharacterized protein